MKWVVLVALVCVGCGKPAVPVQNSSLTYLEASKIVEDEEKELAKLEFQKTEARRAQDEYSHSIAQTFKGTAEELTEELTKVEKQFRATTLTYIDNLIERQRKKVDRAVADREAAKDRP